MTSGESARARPRGTHDRGSGSYTRDELITLADVRAADRRVGDAVRRTPTVPVPIPRETQAVELHVKLELLQPTGSFKVRGAFNKLLSMSEAELKAGLVSISSGNFAAALAHVAALVGTRATVVMPTSARRSKVEAAASRGAEVILTDDDVLAICREVQRERGLSFVHPFDDPVLMAGHGTIGPELLADVPHAATVVVPIGGGGLIGGVSTAVKAINPEIRVIGVEPVGAEAMTQALRAGRPVRVGHSGTIADGLDAPFVGTHTLAHARAFVDQVVLVSDAQIAAAQGCLLDELNLTVEPAGAAAVAGVLTGAVHCLPRSVTACVVSGGNDDSDAASNVERMR